MLKEQLTNQQQKTENEMNVLIQNPDAWVSFHKWKSGLWRKIYKVFHNIHKVLSCLSCVLLLSLSEFLLFSELMGVDFQKKMFLFICSHVALNCRTAWLFICKKCFLSITSIVECWASNLLLILHFKICNIKICKFCLTMNIIIGKIINFIRGQSC